MIRGHFCIRRQFLFEIGINDDGRLLWLPLAGLGLVQSSVGYVRLSKLKTDFMTTL